MKSLQEIFDKLFTDMLAQSSQLILTGELIAGLAALFYIAKRVWPKLAKGEELDPYPLLRPFAIGIAISLYPYLIAFLNGVLSPVCEGTAAMQTNATASIETLLKQKEDLEEGKIPPPVIATPNDEAQWEKYADAGGSPGGGSGAAGDNSGGFFNGVTNFFYTKVFHAVDNTMTLWISKLFEVVFEAAALCISALRTFNLIVLAILGPVILGLSVFDGFHHTLTHWLSRYITVYIWNAVANIFGAIIATIQTMMLQADISSIQSTGTTSFSPTNIGYIIFLIIGISGYFSVPSVTAQLIQAGGGDAIASKANQWIRTFFGNLKQKQ